ncbi:hypothetical protein Hanom_Chr16g01498721 [Helianthus anomalus]
MLRKVIFRYIVNIKNIEYEQKLTFFLLSRCLNCNCMTFSSLLLLFSLFTKKIHTTVIIFINSNLDNTYMSKKSHFSEC